jgi:hypothetical protein
MPFVSHKRFLELEARQKKLEEEFDRIYEIALWHSRRNAMLTGCDHNQEFTRLFEKLRREQLSKYRYCWVTLEWYKQL